MNLKTILLSAALASSAVAAAGETPKRFTETPEQKAERMQWFADAKLGIFIHWGVYSKGETSESWAFHNGHISLPDYMKQAEAFTAANYDPEYWAKLIKESGAKYTVITTKHHDGFALWDTKAGKVSAVKSSPAKRDVIDPFAKAVRDQGLKLGFYYSLIDWPHPDYPETYRDKAPKYDLNAEPERWQGFVDFNKAQLAELSSKWNPDLYWFDGDWEHSSEQWDAPGIVAQLHSYRPGVIVNSRIQGNGDYETPELGVPVTRPNSQWWETCMTSNDSWGYRVADTNFKSSKTIIKMLADCINLGGNLLLDIGPKADGTIPEEQVQILKDLGRWTSKHAEAIYGTRAGIPAGHVQAYTALNKTGDIIYVFLPYVPNEALEFKGLKSYIKKARVVGTDKELDWNLYNDVSWGVAAGCYYINVPAEVCDPDMTVLALELEEPVKLYAGAGQVMTFNDMEGDAAKKEIK